MERSLVHGAPTTFDVFDAAGNLVRRVVLPAGRRLVAVGATVLYLAAQAEDGLETLERYRRP